MKLERAELSELRQILDLLEKNELPLEGVTENLKNFRVLKDQEEIIGCAGLEIYGNVGLLRSVAVRKENRGQGLGISLTQRMLELGRRNKVKKIYLLTTTADGFFKKFGFEPIEREQVDPAIRQTAEFTRLCPCSAVVMLKNIF